MGPSRRNSFVRLGVLAAISVLDLAGCASWRLVDREGIPKAIQEGPSLVRVGVNDSLYILRHPSLSRDTLQGYGETGSVGRVAVPISAVSSFSVRQSHPRALAIITGAIVLTVTAFVIAANHSPTIK